MYTVGVGVEDISVVTGVEDVSDKDEAVSEDVVSDRHDYVRNYVPSGGRLRKGAPEGAQVWCGVGGYVSWTRQRSPATDR